MSTIDAQGPIFWFRSVVEDRNGRIVFDGFDPGEVDVDGRISVLLTFGGAAPDSMRSAPGVTPWPALLPRVRERVTGAMNDSDHGEASLAVQRNVVDSGRMQ